MQYDSSLTNPMSGIITNNSNLPAPPLPRTKIEMVQYVVSRVALIAFNLFAFWISPTCWTIGFFVGFIFSQETKERITDLFKSLSWKFIIPASGLLYWLSLPTMLVMQAALAGADFGSCLALTAKSSPNFQTGLFNLIWFKA
jgi:hypothetical protein